MSPLVLVPIGLYALIATVSAEMAFDNAEKPSLEPEQVTLTESVRLHRAIEDMEPTRPSTAALVTTAGLTDPIVKAAVAKALRMQVEKNKHQLVQKTFTYEALRNSKENPGKYFPNTYADDDGGFSAPLGLKDESHNDWMK